jgi:hypothetical protein
VRSHARFVLCCRRSAAVSRLLESKAYILCTSLCLLSTDSHGHHHNAGGPCDEEQGYTLDRKGLARSGRRRSTFSTLLIAGRLPRQARDTALHLSCSLGDKKTCKVLASCLVHVNVFHGLNCPLPKALLRHHAKIGAVNQLGQTPIHVCEAHGHPELASYLRSKLAPGPVVKDVPAVRAVRNTQGQPSAPMSHRKRNPHGKAAYSRHQQMCCAASRFSTMMILMGDPRF